MERRRLARAAAGEMAMLVRVHYWPRSSLESGCGSWCRRRGPDDIETLTTAATLGTSLAADGRLDETS